MKRPRSAVLFTFSCLLAAPLLAQPQIGGGSCTSATLSGNYAVSLTGRQVTSSGKFTNVFQANGSANFDGLSKVTLALTADTLQSVDTPLSWSGTYSMQANCAGVVTITAGGNATLTIVSYNGGVSFLLAGNDSIYSYSGSGNNQPAGCSAATFSGVYTISGTGFTSSGGSVSGATAGSGLLQFDGKSNVTANITISTSGLTNTSISLTGSYQVSSNCTGSATVTIPVLGTFTINLSVMNVTNVNGTDFFITLASQGSGVLVGGSGHPAYGQPAATASDRQSENGGSI